MSEENKVKIDFDILEAIRGIAALYVCIAHCRGVLWIGGTHYLSIHPIASWGILDYFIMGANMLTRLSTEFVIIFFVLSGFSIAYSLRNKTSIKKYAQRRFIRLYPPYVAAIIWAGIVLLIIKSCHPDFFIGKYNTLQFERLKFSLNYFDWNVLLKDMIYIPHEGGIINPFWSLTYEVIFYIVAPVLFLNIRAYYFGSIILFIVGLIIQYSGILSLNILTSFLFNYNLYFMIGVALYHNFETVCLIFKKWSKVSFIGIMFICFGILLTISLYYKNANTSSYILASALAVILIIFFLIHQINIKWLNFVGKFSYTLYITHFATIYLYFSLYYTFFKAEPPYIFNNLVFVPAVFFCLIIAYMHYFFIERRTKMVLSKARTK